MLGIVKTPPTTAPLVISGDKCWSGGVPVILSAVPMEGCPLVFSVYFDEFYCTVFVVWPVKVVSGACIEWFT